MKLDNDTSSFNMGDTSLRVKKQVDMYYLLLSHLRDFSYSNLSWEDKIFQEEFYKSIHKEIIRLENEENISFFAKQFNRPYEIPADSKVGKRARTWTNALVKNGLLTSKRQLSPVAKNYLDHKLQPADSLEKFITSDNNNLLYLRQYFKLRIYSNNGNNYFYNFRFAIKFLTKYTNVPKNNFFRIIESISPTSTIDEINDIINNYKDVKDNKCSFEEYYSKHFHLTLATADMFNGAKKMFEKKDFSSGLFEVYFPNRKSSEKQKLYKDFGLNLIKLVDNQSIEAFEKIKFLSKNPAIKKAFSFNNIPFIFSKGESINDFLENNQNNILLSPIHFNIYKQFLMSKKYDLIREYSDMCVRSFQATGIFNFNNNLVNLNYPWLFKNLLNHLGDKFILCGTEEYESYEEDKSSIWFQDTTLTQIFNISDNDINIILENIKNEFKLDNIDSFETFFEKEKEKEYREFIEEKFPKEEVIKILSNINNRNDNEVFKAVTENATIPTIFEYILTIAWYHISKEKDYSLHKSFQLTLDGDKLPLTHRGGGAGDIEIISKDYSLLIEATLMNSNNQKRAELEPVIRHSVNFKLQQKNQDSVQSIFVANELDTNVLNIFRAMQFVELEGTLIPGTVKGLNIFALKTEDFIQILKNNVSDKTLLKNIKDNLMVEPGFIESSWHEPIRQSILS